MNPEDFAERWAAEQERRYQAQMEAADMRQEAAEAHTAREVSFTEREEFEAWWMLSPMTSNKRPARLPDGQYANSLADHAWNGWQGRAAATIDLTEGMLEKVAAPVVLPERVGRIGHGFALLYRADKPIHQVVKEQGLKIGDDLFSAPQVCKLLARDLGGVNLDRLDKALIKLGYATWVSQAEAAANIPHWVNALTRCVLETPVAAPQPQADCLRETAELKRLSACCPELNMNNYGHDDVDNLNSWAIEVSQYIDRAICQPQADALDAAEQNAATADMLEMLRNALGVAAEPHQTLSDRMHETAEAKQADAARYQWLKARFAGVDFRWRAKGEGVMLAFCAPDLADGFSHNLDDNIDRSINLAKENN